MGTGCPRAALLVQAHGAKQHSTEPPSGTSALFISNTRTQGSLRGSAQAPTLADYEKAG